MRRCRALLGALTAALCTLLALAVAADTAVARSGPQHPAADTPYAAVAAAPAAGPVAGTARGFGASNAEQDRHPGPFDDCRHRRANRASVAAPVLQTEPCTACTAREPAAHTARTPRSATGHAAVAAPLDPGERPALLQVFRC
ncbi:hypothetical protein [Streptomyces cavernicola]|uniref:Uncharacterized protein n=1 Tax=Streptomyces cavernicola TaxID=3043613 RepID=A0ABT6SGY9_9ACTN|nr:hypothetical protein [Streptomyces sp. B-S-A6]MDI3407264.1 hypothetical protein [Streptomyces sp. B-S-A6]